jgi:hypothetical protein
VVVREDRVLLCVPGNAVPCIRRGRRRLALVRWELVRDCRLRVLRVLGAVPVDLRVVRVSVMFLAESKKAR